jgi:hypothetical protein
MRLNEDQQKIVVGLSHIWRYPPLFIQRAYERLLFTKDIQSSSPKQDEPSGIQSCTLKELCLRELEDDLERHDFPVKYSFRHAKEYNPNNHLSALQQALIVEKPTITKKMKKYLRALSILEYEHDHGSLSDQDYNVSMIYETVWTPSEKKRFFIALDRCGKGNIEEITRRVGPTKTMTEVNEYLNVLELAAKGLHSEKIEHPFAREMSNTFILQEEHLGKEINRAIEVESYENHLKLCSAPELQKSIEFFELWNLSSMTRLYSKTNQMTLLCSTTFNFYQLVKKFIQDVMIDLHTHQLTRKDKTVTKSLINFIIAKRDKQRDKRLSKLDILSSIEKRRLLRTNRYPGHRSISYYAKRRRLRRGNEELYPDEFVIGNQEEKEKDKESVAIFISDDDEDEDENMTEEEEDPMLEDIDSEDELRQEVAVQDLDYEHEEKVKEHLEKTVLEETFSFNGDSDNDTTVDRRSLFVYKNNSESEESDEVMSSEEEDEETSVKDEKIEEQIQQIEIKDESMEIDEKDKKDEKDEKEIKKEAMDEQDEKDEKEMKKQDALDEQKMLEYLGFNTKEEILLASTRPLADRSHRIFYHTLRNKV